MRQRETTGASPNAVSSNIGVGAGARRAGVNELTFGWSLYSTPPPHQQIKHGVAGIPSNRVTGRALRSGSDIEVRRSAEGYSRSGTRNAKLGKHTF